jgi:hypothetical protein
VPRPSSPLGAKAFTRCPSLKLAHAQPQTRKIRDQRAENRGRTKHYRSASISPSEPGDLRLQPRHKPCSTGTTRPGVFAYPCPGPNHHRRLRPASRSRLASRCQRSDDREQRTDPTIHRAVFRRKLEVPTTANPPEGRRPRHLSSVVCSLSSEPGGPGPTRTADLTLIRRAL